MGSNNYFVNDLNKTAITLAKGEKLQIDVLGFTEQTLPELQGYKFKLNNTIQYNGKYIGATIEVKKPDGTTIIVNATKISDALLSTDGNGHQIQIRAFQVTELTSVIIVYDVSTKYTLENNKKNDGWKVRIDKDFCNKVGIEDYGTPESPLGNANLTHCLTKLTLTQEDAQTLNVGDTVFFPTKAVKFSYEGFKDEDFGDVKCSGGDDKIKIETSDNRKVILSFTTRDGERLNNVRLDEGAYELDELFLIGNTVYKFRGTEDINNDENHVKLLLTDVSNANDFEVTLTKLSTGFAGFTYTYFDKYSANKENPCSPPCSTFNGNVLGVMAYFHEGKLWMDKENDNKIGLNDVDLTDIQNDNCPARLSTLFENGIDQNGEGAYNNNIDDQILVFEGCGKDMMYIDFYDTGRFARGMGDYRTSVKITGTDTTLVTLSGLMCFNTTGLGFAGALNCWEDTKLWSPRGADMITVTNYGSDRQVKAVEICHPTKKAYITYFLGKEKTESETMTTIIAEDVGKLKQTGCCEAIVKSFGLSAGNAASATGTCQNMKPVGTIVVTNATANTNNNLIVIGKPSVNPLSTGVTDEEIHNDPEKYVIKLVNNHTLVVAGWEGNDTIAAANKVIEWLLANAHDGGTTTTYTTLDVNNDGSVDIFDAIKILEFISGI